MVFADTEISLHRPVTSLGQWECMLNNSNAVKTSPNTLHYLNTLVPQRQLS